MTRLLAIGLLALSLTAFVGCSSKEYVSAPEVVHIAPPAVLMMPTPEPQCNATVNGELAGCIFDMRAALRRAKADKAAMREVVEGWAQ